MRGPISVLGPGTGLGVALLVGSDANGWHVVETEGGHVGFSPIGDEERAAVDRVLEPRGVVQVGGGPTQRVRRRRAGLGPAGPQVRVGVDVRHACAVPSAPSALSRCARTNHWNFSSSWSWPISRSFVTRSSFSVASAAERCARMTPV